MYSGIGVVIVFVYHTVFVVLYDTLCTTYGIYFLYTVYLYLVYILYMYCICVFSVYILYMYILYVCIYVYMIVFR